MNKRDGGNRKFILVEMEEYAESITAERVKRVIRGYKTQPPALQASPPLGDQPSLLGVNLSLLPLTGGLETNGTGGGFDFYDLGSALLTSEGLLVDEA